MKDVRVRPAVAEDYTFLATMLGEAAVWRPDKPTPSGDQVLADPGDEVLDDLEVDVGLEEGEPDLAHGGVHVGLADPAAAGQVAERLSQPLAEGVEHGSDGAPSDGGPGRRTAVPGGARVLTHRAGRVYRRPRGSAAGR